MSFKVYGNKERGIFPSETAEMVSFFNILNKRYPTLRRLATHIKNEGKRSYYQANNDKMMGMIKGFADIVIVGNPTFVCEMKKKSNSSRLSSNQNEFLKLAHDNGAFACVAYGHEAALNAVEDWLNAQR